MGFALRRAALGLLFASVLRGQAAVQNPRQLEISGLPALNFDADEGFGYGVIMALYDYAGNAHPYRYTLQPTLFLTTHGRRDLTLFYDAPSVLPAGWRLSGYLGREQQLSTPYYGIGDNTTYSPSLEQGGSPYYYRYGRLRLSASGDAQHGLGRSPAHVLVGFGISHDHIHAVPFDSGTTLLQVQLAGATDTTGWTNYVRVGLGWDTRDREIGTHSGSWAEVLAQRSTKLLGASYDFMRLTATVREYVPLGDRVTLADRLLVQDVSGNAPFYELAAVETPYKAQDGLGGASTIRGVPKDRYIGKSMALSNTELRWRAADFGLLGRPSSLTLSTFLDAGRVWQDGIDATTLTEGIHAGYGAGARLGFGSSFVVALDVGHSRDATAPIYIGLGYLF